MSVMRSSLKKARFFTFSDGVKFTAERFITGFCSLLNYNFTVL